MDGVTFTRDVSLRSVSIGSINRVEINFSFLRYWRIDCKRFPLDLFEFIATVILILIIIMILIIIGILMRNSERKVILKVATKMWKRRKRNK